MSLFKKKGRLLTIEINDEKIDGHIARHIKSCEGIIDDLEKSLKKDDYPQKDEDIRDLMDRLKKILDEAKSLKEDVATIRLTEMAQKNYVRVNDEQYLLDKNNQLEKLVATLDDLMTLLQEYPSDDELEHGLLEKIYSQMNALIDSLNAIRSDDSHLKVMYERLGR